MCGDWLPISRLPNSEGDVLLQMADGDVCGGRRGADGRFYRMLRPHTPENELEPAMWARMPAEGEFPLSRLRYEPRGIAS